MQQNDIDEKSQEAEAEFRGFMDRAEIPYLPISNEMGKFSAAMKAVLNTKRPDYLLLLGKAGMLPVDVKFQFDRRGKEFTFGTDEVERYLNFSEAFGVDVWYAISNRQMQYATWYWLSVNQVRNGNFPVRKNGNGKEEFYAVPMKKTIEVMACNKRPLEEVIHKLTLPHQK